MTVINFLKSLMGSLFVAYIEEINWYSTAGNIAIGGWVACAAGSVVAVPPLATAGV
jgi:hypothetical protein